MLYYKKYLRDLFLSVVVQTSSCSFKKEFRYHLAGDKLLNKPKADIRYFLKKGQLTTQSRQSRYCDIVFVML